MSTTQNKKDKKNKSNEAKLIANCFNAIAAKLSDKTKSAPDVMLEIQKVTENTVKLFAKTNDNVKYGDGDEQQETAENLTGIETAIGHEILRGYLKGIRLDTSKVLKSKFYKDVKQAITAAEKSLGSTGTSGNLSQAQTEALTKVKHKASNAAEFLATLFQIVQEYYESNQSAALSVIVGLITNLNEAKPIVVAKGRSGHMTVLADQEVKNAAKQLKTNWSTYRAMDEVKVIDLSKPKPTPKNEREDRPPTDLSEIDRKLGKVQQSVDSLTTLKLAQLENKEFTKAAKEMKKLSEVKVEINKDKEYLPVETLKAVMRENAFDKDLKELETAATAYEQNQSAETFNALNETKNKKIKDCSLSRIIKSLYQLTLTSEGRVNVLSTLVYEKDLNVERITKIYNALTNMEAKKEERKKQKTNLMNDTIVKLTNRVILCNYLTTTPITIEYSEEKEYSEALTEELEKINVTTIKVGETGLETEENSLDTLMKEKLTGEEDIEQTQSYARKHLDEIKNANENAGELIVKMIGENIKTEDVKPEEARTVKVGEMKITKEDWDYSQNVDGKQDTKDYKVNAEKEGVIELTKVPEKSDLHGLVHEKGVKLTHDGIEDLIEDYKQKDEKYLGQSTLPAHAKEGKVAQSTEKAQEIILKELDGLEEKHFRTEKGEKLYITDEGGIDEVLAKKVLAYQSVIKTLVERSAVTDDVLKLVAQLETGAGKHKLLVTEEGVQELEKENAGTKKTKSEPKQTTANEKKNEENTEQKEEKINEEEKEMEEK